MNFNNKYITYNQNALVQKELVNDLLSLLKINSTSKYSSMFEIGLVLVFSLNYLLILIIHL